jgi:hydroxymethylglutaryl-CoA reductase (NADPH)
VGKLAEIIAATVLCGDLSLGSAVVADEWVEAHDELGRNR